MMIVMTTVMAKKMMILIVTEVMTVMTEVVVVLVASEVTCPGPLHQTLSVLKTNPLIPGSFVLILHIGLTYPVDMTDI